MLFIDTDEFLVIRGPAHVSLDTFLREFEDAGGLAVNWQASPFCPVAKSTAQSTQLALYFATAVLPAGCMSQWISNIILCTSLALLHAQTWPDMGAEQEDDSTD